MKFIVLTNNRVSLPVLGLLHSRSALAGICSTRPLSPDAPELEAWASAARVPFITTDQQQLDACIEQLQQLHGTTAVLAFGFPWKLALPPNASHFYNIHFSLLPRYAGPIPVFWQLRNGDPEGGVTLHRMSGRMDAGPILFQKPVRLLPGENYGLYSTRLSRESVGLVQLLLQQLASGMPWDGVVQDAARRTYHGKPTESDLCIDWERHDALSIEHLVNACNPVATGAWTWHRQQPLQVLEVTPTDGTTEEAPGTIVYADPGHGLFVACCDRQVLRLSVLRLQEGIFSGNKLAALGFTAKTRFHNNPQLPTKKHSLIS